MKIMRLLVTGLGLFLLVFFDNLLAADSRKSSNNTVKDAFNSVKLSSSDIRYLTTYLDQFSTKLDAVQSYSISSGYDDTVLREILDYDLIGAAHKLYKSTKQKKYLNVAEKSSQYVIDTFIIPSNAVLAAYRIYLVEGLSNVSIEIQKTNPSLSSTTKNAVVNISRNATFVSLTNKTREYIQHPFFSREVANIILAKSFAYQLSSNTNKRSFIKDVSVYKNAMRNHFELWKQAQVNPSISWPNSFVAEDAEWTSKDVYVRPFMVALSLRSAVKYYSITKDTSLLNAGIDAILAIAKTTYTPHKGFRYTDRNLPAESLARKLSSDTRDDYVAGSLNSLVRNAILRASTVADPKRARLLKRLANTIKKDIGAAVPYTLKEVLQRQY